MGGDGVAAPNDDVVRATLAQDSSLETLALYVERSRNGGAFGRVAASLTLGFPGETANLSPRLLLSDGNGLVSNFTLRGAWDGALQALTLDTLSGDGFSTKWKKCDMVVEGTGGGRRSLRSELVSARVD